MNIGTAVRPIDTLESRIAAAIAHGKACRRCGMVEQYIETHHLIQSLQLELAMRQLRRSEPAGASAPGEGPG